MSDSKIAFTTICLLFFMLWMPLGQQDFLIDNWMKIGTYVAPFLLFLFFSSRQEAENPTFFDGKSIALLMLIAYFIHQYEEHWLDLYGNYYAFFTSTNELLRDVLGIENNDIVILTREAIFAINTSLVWLVGAIAIWRSPKHFFPTIAMAGIILVNAMTHIIAGLFKQSYNPGLLTAVVIFIPFGLIFLRKALLRTVSSAKIQVFVGILWAIIGHLIMVGGLIAANWLMLFPEYVYFIALAIWSVLPLFLFASPNHSV
ncbi:MAG: HXXEE domain-containing protein [Cyanobacteria bacterium P01_E01_bin.42]